jgi:prepilin-type N-terminal cleavage/methylation domain-containing protein
MKNKGFTLIEVMIVVAIIGIVSLFAFNITSGTNDVGFGTLRVTPTGMVSEQCLSGYKFIIDSGGNARQVLDEFGKGVRCQ